jgi:hypothetical protein
VLGRKSFTLAEVEGAKAWVRELRGAYDDVAGGRDFQTIEPLFFNSLLLALDRPFVHRTRAAVGKDGTPLNELELYVSALMDHDGVLTEGSVITLDSEESVVGIAYGDRVQLDAEQFDQLAAAVFTELEAKFLDA